MADLTEKQRMFCREYIVDLNMTQAAIRAGYSENAAGAIGSENLTKPEIQEYVQRLMDRRAKRLEIDSDYVLSTVHETIERCRQVEPVRDRKGRQVYVETPDGQQAPAFTFDATGVLKGTELLGKHLKLFADKMELTGKDGAPLPTPISQFIINGVEVKNE